VTDPNGFAYFGNVFVDGASARGGVADAKNNVEQVHLTAPVVGDWQVRVDAPAVNVGAQGYAVVITGQVGPSAKGDLNCDSVVDFRDINPFVLALSDPTGYAQTYPNCQLLNADVNGDTVVDFRDINPFVALLAGQ
jgi:hypothetical protein